MARPRLEFTFLATWALLALAMFSASSCRPSLNGTESESTSITSEIFVTAPSTSASPSPSPSPSPTVLSLLGIPHHLVFGNQPAQTTVAGAAITPAVTVIVKDALNNTVTETSVTVSLAFTSASPAGATLSGTITIATHSGVAMFSNMSINKAASGYSLAATSDGLTQAISNSFDIIAGNAAKLSFLAAPSNVASEAAISPSVKVRVLDSNDNLISASTAPITIAIQNNPAGGTLSGTATVNAASGVATFSDLNLDKAGAGYILRATSPSLSAADSSAFNVTAGAPAKLAFLAQPSNTASGNAIGPEVTVLVQDVRSNTVTDSTLTVVLAIGNNPGPGTLAGTASRAAVGGIATFNNITINKAASGYTLTASSTGLTGTTSNAFNISAGAPAKLAFSAQPGNVGGGTIFGTEIKVQVLDLNNNFIASSAAPITVAIQNNPAGGSLLGTTTVNAVNGVATFSNLSIDNAGTGYVLRVTSPLLTEADSDAFNVTAGAPAKLAFLAQPSLTAAGSAIAPDITVLIQDTGGNTVANSTATVVITIGNNPGLGNLDGTTSRAAVAGVATFNNLAIDKAATGYTLTAASAGLSGATSNAFNISAGAPAKLAFAVEPTDTNAAAILGPSPQVMVQDAYENTATTATNAITIVIDTNPGGGTIDGTTAINAVNGIATFSNLSIAQDGAGYTLSASAPGLTGATSAAFTLTYVQTWTATTTTSAPSGRYWATSIWTGSKMIIWGGDNSTLNSDGAQYDPVANAWSATTATGAPQARELPSAVWTGSKMILWGGFNGSTYLTDGAQYNPIANSWSATTTTGAPQGRHYQTAIWSGSKMIVWGGYNGNDYLNDGGQYDPVANSWSATTTTGAPQGRAYPTAIWSGSKMIVWGGDNGVTFLNDGGQYDPAANSWTATTTTGAPQGRSSHTVVWTGSKMIVWGGANGSHLNSGGQYDPAANSWTATTTTGAPSGRRYQTAVWTGAKMIVFGGFNGITFFNDGRQYNPISNSWTALSTTNAPMERDLHSAVWTGAKMIVWGGFNNGTYLNTGGILDPGGQPATDTWSATTSTGALSARRYHTAVWTGAKVIVWGGWSSGSSYYNDGAQYDPVANSWSATSATSAPSARYMHTAIWTGAKMIVWGGYGGSYFDNGGQYDPVADTWTATTTSGAATARGYHTSVWTGAKMIVWGGNNGSYLNDGGQYDPAANSWNTITTTGAPSARYLHSANWIGAKMIIWGGYYGPSFSYYNDGGQYDPVGNSWNATTTAGAPSSRRAHTAVWTGSTLIIWGGYNGSYVNSGSLYDPLANSWNAITTTNAPNIRAHHTAIWTGAKMIVWGGYSGSSYLSDGSQYNLVANSWTAMTTNDAPSGRYNHIAVWTGTIGDSQGGAFKYNLNNNGDMGRMIIWGGLGSTTVTATGGIYTP